MKFLSCQGYENSFLPKILKFEFCICVVYEGGDQKVRIFLGYWIKYKI